MDFRGLVFSDTDKFIAVCSLLFTVFLIARVNPSTIVTDEVAYSLMAYSFATHGGLEIWNGFDEAQSFELQLPATELASNGVEVRMFGIPAPLYTFIAYPFFKVGGLGGLFSLNIVSYSAIFILVYLTAKIFLDDKLSAAAALMYSLMTISLSLTSYIIPHLLSTALICLSAFLVFSEVLAGGRKSVPLFAAGFIGGLAVGVRFTDVLFILILSLLALLQDGRRGLYAFASGLSVPLFLIALIDLYMYGSVFETGYGSPYGNPLDFLRVRYVIPCVLLAAGYMLLRKRKVDYRGLLPVIALLGLLVVALSWGQITAFLTQFYARIFDMSLEPTVTKVTYKKALLQSTPFLILSVLSFLHMTPGKKRRILLSIISMAYLNVFLYSGLTQHGGSDETFSMRYLMTSVPFLVILSVYSFDRLVGSVKRRESALMAAAFILVAFLYLRDGNILYSTNRLLRALPSMLSLLTLATGVIYLKLKGSRQLFIALFAACLAVSFSYSYSDWLIMGWYSKAVYDVESKIADAIADESAVFVSQRTDAVLLVPAKMHKRVRVAVASMDDRVHTPALVEYYVKNGIPVYYLNVNDHDEEWLGFFGNISRGYDGGEVQSLNAVAVYDDGKSAVLGLTGE